MSSNSVPLPDAEISRAFASPSDAVDRAMIDISNCRRRI